MNLIRKLYNSSNINRYNFWMKIFMTFMICKQTIVSPLKDGWHPFSQDEIAALQVITLGGRPLTRLKMLDID